MANLEWHTRELNKIRSGMQRQQKSGKTGQPGGRGREQAASDVSRSRRTSPLLQRLRKARRVKGGYEPDLADGFYDSLQDAPEPQSAPRNESPLVKWAQRSAMYALVPLSLIGTATLFVVGFVGSHMIVEYLVGTEYLPTTANAPSTVQQAEVAPAPVTPAPDVPAPVQPAPVTSEPEPAAVPVIEQTNEPATLNTTAVPVTPPASEPELQPSGKVEERLAQDDTATASPVTAEVNGTTSIITASAQPLAEETQPEPNASSTVQPSTAEPVAPPEPQTAAVETVPAETSEPKAETRVEPTATKPIVRSLVESVFGLGESAKPVEQAPAQKPNVNVEPAGASVAGSAPQAAEPAGNQQQAALSVNQQPSGPSRLGRGLPDSIKVSKEEAIRMFGEGQNLMASGDIRQARGLFARSLASGMPEAALALGRSYDPKYIARIENANAEADAEAARNWYEEWYRQSVEQGSISSDVRLDRLLQTMNAN